MTDQEKKIIEIVIDWENYENKNYLILAKAIIDHFPCIGG